VIIPLVCGLILAVPSAAQRGAAEASASDLHLHHADVERLLIGIERAHSLLYEQLLAEPGAPVERLEGEFFDRVLAQTVDGDGAEVASTPNLTRLSPRLVSVMERTYALQRQVYEIYSDASVTDKKAAVDAVVDQYLTQPELALSPLPKSMEIMDEQHGSMLFREKYPRTAGLYWAFRWLQLGGSEPLMFYPTAAEQHNGLEATTARFREMVANPPESFPSHMPMAPTVAPEMVTRHTRAAAIFDNLNMMHDVLADVITSTEVSDKRAAVEETIDIFTDPQYLQVSEIDWIRMALRHGIYAQGGPAIGRLDRPERNAIHNHTTGTDGRMRPPGM
jgi:hypothetical protein